MPKVVKSSLKSSERGGNMLYGKYKFSINEKGRLFVPAKMRDSLGEKFILSQSPIDDCLVMYTQEEWARIQERLDRAPTATKAVRRRLFGNAVEMELDKQGRMIVPQEHREYAKLSGDVIILGVGSSAEVWNAERYAEYEAQEDNEQMEQLLKELDL